MSLGTLVLIDTILLAFIAWRVNDLYQDRIREGVEKFKNMSPEDIDLINSLEVDKAMMESKAVQEK